MCPLCQALCAPFSVSTENNLSIQTRLDMSSQCGHAVWSSVGWLQPSAHDWVTACPAQAPLNLLRATAGGVPTLLLSAFCLLVAVQTWSMARCRSRAGAAIGELEVKPARVTLLLTLWSLQALE